MSDRTEWFVNAEAAENEEQAERRARRLVAQGAGRTIVWFRRLGHSFLASMWSGEQRVYPTPGGP